MECGGGGRWDDITEPDLRLHAVQKTVPKLAELFGPENKPPPEILHELAVKFEEDIFQCAENKIDYMRRISSRIMAGQQLRNLQAAADRQQQQMQLPGTVQAIQEVNYPFTTFPQAGPMMASHSRPPFQSPYQDMTCPSASNMWIDDDQGPSDRMAMPYQIFNSLPETVAPVAPSVHCGQQIAQSIYMQSHNQCPAMQLHPANVAQCHLASMGAQLQGQPFAPPYEHQNHLRQNVSAYAPHLQPTIQQQHFGITQQQAGMQSYQMLEANAAKMNTMPHLQPTIQQQHFGITQQQAGMQSYQMLEAKAAKMNNSYFGGPNNQQNAGWASGLQSQLKAWEPVAVEAQAKMESQPIAPAQGLITANQQSDLHCPSSQNPGRTESAREMEHVAVERQTNMEFQPIPPVQAIGLTADIQFVGDISNQQQLPPDESIGQMRQNIATSPSAVQKTHSNQLKEVTNPYFSIKAPGALQSSLTSTVKLHGTLSPIAKFGAASPKEVLKSKSQSPISKAGVVAAASPSVSVKSTLTSSPNLEESGFQAAASPCASVKTASPLAIAKSGNVPVDSPSDSDSSFLLNNNTAENSCNQATLTKLLTPEPPCKGQTPASQAEDQEHGGAETLVAEKPIDRLIAAVLSSSPAMLHSSVNLMKSELSAMDSVPPRVGSKCVYNVTSPALGSTGGRTVTFELDASNSTSSYGNFNMQKTQNAKDALLEEIAAINNRLIDTLISVTSDDTVDGINGTTLVKLSYTAVSLSPGLKSQFAISENFYPVVMPMTLLIPADYPRSSPVIVDDEGDAQLRKKFSCISAAVDGAFRLALRNIQEPRSLKETARTWDSCVRRAITEYACRLGGGTLSSSLGLHEGWVGE